MHNKKSQVWHADFAIGLIIFIAALSLYSSYNIDEGDSSLENILSDAKSVSSYLMGVGYPKNWNSTNVTLIGITNDDARIDNAKLNSLLGINYSSSRGLLNTKYDFYFHLQDRSGCFISISGVYGYGHNKIQLVESPGDCFMPEAKNMSINFSSIAPKKLVRIDRLAIYNSTIVKMVLHEWS